MTKIIPHLGIRNCSEAIEFYKKAFGAENPGTMHDDQGRVMHAYLTIDGQPFYATDEFPEYGGKSPQGLGGTPVTIHLQVDDCDAVFNKAVDAGCQVIMPMADQFWGDRYGQVEDPYGFRWSIATTTQQLSNEEIKKAMDEMIASGAMDGGCGPEGSTTERA